MNDLNRIRKNAGLKEQIVESVKVEDADNMEELPIDELSELYNPEIYAEKLKEFMKIDETAGVGVNAEFNTYPYTPDIKKGTLKKTGKQMGFNITDDGIPPRISKDSVNKSKE